MIRCLQPERGAAARVGGIDGEEAGAVERAAQRTPRGRGEVERLAGRPCAPPGGEDELNQREVEFGDVVEPEPHRLGTAELGAKPLVSGRDGANRLRTGEVDGRDLRDGFLVVTDHDTHLWG